MTAPQGTKDGATDSTKREAADIQANRLKLYRFALALWSCVAVVALLVPWPYALVAVLFATFLHLASLDGDTPTRQNARRKYGR